MLHNISFLVVFLTPIIPAVVVAVLIGIKRPDAQASGSLFGIHFNAGGGVATYVIFTILAYWTYTGIDSKGETYEIALNLQGPASSREIFLRDLGSFEVSFRAKDNPADRIVFSRFSIDTSRTKIRSSVSAPSLIPGNRYTEAAIFPAKTDSFSLTLNPSQLRITNHMEAILDVAPVDMDTDPLTTKNVPFSRDDWVVAFKSSLIYLFDDDSGRVQEIRQSFIFRNETSSRLSTIRVPAYQLNGAILEFEGQARLISGALIDSTLVEYRGNSLPRSSDSSQVLEKLETLNNYLSSRGTEIGYFNYKDSQLVSDERRAERFKLVANNTLWSVGPIAEGIDPNNGVAVLIRIKFSANEKAVQPGRAEHFGVLLPYPTRMFYIASVDRAAGILIDEASSRIEVTERSGAKANPKESSTLKKSDRSLIFVDSLADRDTKVQLQWVWRKAK